MRKSCMFSSLVQPFVYLLLIFIVIFLFKKKKKRKKSVLGKGSQTNTSPNKEEGRKLHHKAGTGKWNNLKHGFWDVLLCCFWEHSWNKKVWRGGKKKKKKRADSSFRRLKEICACATSTAFCAFVYGCVKPAQHIQCAFLPLFCHRSSKAAGL